jgi:Zn-finger nucleic acid-binding protein
MMSTCPRQHGPMESYTTRGTQVARCMHCDGIWVSGASLRTLLTLPAPSGTHHTPAQLGALKLAQRDTPECPHCSGTMPQLMQPVQRSGVEIDVCPQCHSVWMDDGELAKAFPADGLQSPDPVSGLSLQPIAESAAQREAARDKRNQRLAALGVGGVSAAALLATAQVHAQNQGQGSSYTGDVVEGAIEIADATGLLGAVADGALSVLGALFDAF